MTRLNRRRFTTLGSAGAVAAVVAVLVAALAGGVLSSPAEATKSPNRGLTGTWALTVRFPDGTENPTLISFDRSGSLVETNALTRSTGLGTWWEEPRGHHRYVFWEQFFDSDNVLQSHIRVEHEITLARDGSTYEGEGHGQIYDVDWNLIDTVPTTVEARRLD